MKEGRVVLVTGASQGIGRAVATALGKAGWSVVLAARHREALEVAAQEIRRAGGDALAWPTDVTVEAEAASLLEAVRARWGRLDLLVHCAGYGVSRPMDQTTLAEWQETLATNLTGVFLVTRAALPLLEQTAAPQVVVLASVAARRAYPRWSAYAASKAGLLGLVQVMREEFRSRGIRVTAILPGATDTPLWHHIEGEWDRRRMIRPEEVARVILAAAEAPPEASVEEIVVAPAGGDL